MLELAPVSCILYCIYGKDKTPVGSGSTDVERASHNVSEFDKLNAPFVQPKDSVVRGNRSEVSEGSKRTLLQSYDSSISNRSSGSGDMISREVEQSVYMYQTLK